MVMVTSLKVHITKDGDGWFAQGLDIDYAACGGSVDEAKKNFELGFFRTIESNIEKFGNVKHMMKIAGREAWDAFHDSNVVGSKHFYSCFSLTQKRKFKIPYNGIQFILPVQAAA